MSVVAEQPQTVVSSRKMWFVLFGLIAGMFVAVLDQTVFGTALPTIVGELHGVEHMLWVTTAYSLASTIMLPISGKLGDVWGHKRLFIASIVVFVIGSVIGGMAPNMTWLIVGRVVQGFGGGGLMIQAIAVLTHLVPPSETRKYTPFFGLTFGLSSVIGPLVGGWFTSIGHWRWVLQMNVPVGILAIIAVSVFVPKLSVTAVRKKFDYAGIALLSLASTAIVLTTSWGGSMYSWSSPVIILLIVGAVLCGGTFVAVEYAADDPIMPWSLFKNRNFTLVTIAGLVLGLVMMGVLAYLPTYIQMVSGASPTMSGVYMLPMVGGMLVVSFIVNMVISRTDHYKWAPLSGMAVMAVSLCLLYTMTSTMPMWHFFVFLGVMGVGMGMTMQTLMLVVRNETPLSLAGTANASNVYFRTMGMTLGASIIGSLFVSRLQGQIAERLPGVPLGSGGQDSLTPAIVGSLPSGVKEAVVASYNDALTPVFLWIVPLVVFAFVLLLFLREKPLRKVLDHESALL